VYVLGTDWAVYVKQGLHGQILPQGLLTLWRRLRRCVYCSQRVSGFPRLLESPGFFPVKEWEAWRI